MSRTYRREDSRKAERSRRKDARLAKVAAGDRDGHGMTAETRTGRCRAYLRSRGLFAYSGRRCERAAGHSGQHSTARSGIGAPFAFRWGRA
jgi:hypothetical protein